MTALVIATTSSIQASTQEPINLTNQNSETVILPPTTTSDRLAQINTLRDITYDEWADSYHANRRQPRYSWMDWSQDGCSVPEFVLTTAGYQGYFHYACLRHDFMWRTLPIADRANGRVWNERNRLVADSTFEDDLDHLCGDDDSGHSHSRLLCSTAADRFYNAIRSHGGKEITPTEQISVNAQPTDYIEYPSYGTVDCSSNTNRCLPIHYIELNGRPFVPQNSSYIAHEATFKMSVIRANLQTVDGPPVPEANVNHRGDANQTGELVLRVHWPFRAAKNLADLTCPTLYYSTPGHQDIYIDSVSYPTSTSDTALKKTTVHFKACSTTSETTADFIRLLPRTASYQTYTGDHDPTGTYYQYGTADQVRHYENINVSACHALSIPMTGRVDGTWLGTDCQYSRRSNAYVDYYKFIVPTATNLTVDLFYTAALVDPYLYIHDGDTITPYSFNGIDDDSGHYINARVVEDFDPGTYTIAATTYGYGRTGDYGIETKETNTCNVTDYGTANSITSEWVTADCESSRRAGSYVNYYEFTVEGTISKYVTISLNSDDADPYMFLISGNNPTGTGYLDYDDDDGGSLNSLIQAWLYPGTYIVAATTYDEWETGSYTLSIRSHTDS